MQLLHIQHSNDLLGLRGSSQLQAIDEQSFEEHRPDEHWVALDEQAGVQGYCSLWWRKTPSHQTERIGVVGHFAATHPAIARTLLDHACDRLRAVGCRLAVGPMDGNTWRRYRFVIERGDEPTFFLEPDNPDPFPQYFSDAGFDIMARYSSALATDLSRTDPRLERFESRLRDLGAEVRDLQMSEYDEELHRIYECSLASFTRNFLYTPISKPAFVHMYRKIQAWVRPELVLLVQRKCQTLGYVFALPDLSQAQRGVAIDTVILKTVAVLPERRHAGLGAWLVAQAQRRAHELGYRRCIHALMHDSNASTNISRRYAQIIRRYALFQKRL